MLQLGFANSCERVRAHYRDGRSFMSNVKGVASERDFLGAPGAGTADEALSNEENRVHKLLQAATKLGEFPAESAAHLFAHFTVRLRSTRTFMQQGGQRVLQEFGRHLEQGADNMLRAVYGQESHAAIRRACDEAFKEEWGASALKRLKRSPQYVGVLSNFAQKFRAAVTSDAPDGIRSFVRHAERSMDTIALTAHTKAILQSPTPASRREVFEGFVYEVRESSERLILGDSVAWGMSTDALAFPLHHIPDDTEVVVMPLAQNRYLIGAKSSVPKMDGTQLRTASAQCSESFIIAHPDDAAAVQLRSLISCGYMRSLERVATLDW